MAIESRSGWKVFKTGHKGILFFIQPLVLSTIYLGLTGPEGFAEGGTFQATQPRGMESMGIHVITLSENQ